METYKDIRSIIEEQAIALEETEALLELLRGAFLDPNGIPTKEVGANATNAIMNILTGIREKLMDVLKDA